MDNLTIIIPFFNGQEHIQKLLDCLPQDAAPIIIVDDVSDEPYQLNRRGTKVIRLNRKGYFTGAVNFGISQVNTDVLVLNQDAYFRDNSWVDFIEGYRPKYAMIGERIKGTHPVWSDGYIHGTFMFIRNDAIKKIGLLNDIDYPLWGSTCEYQVRLKRAGMPVLAVDRIPGFIHQREGRYGEAITTVLEREPSRTREFIRTPPEVSVIIPCYNYGRFLNDAVHSLIGGKTSLGIFPQQSFASFEVVIVDDGSDINTRKTILKLADNSKGVRYVRRKSKGGTAAAINTGIRNSYGRYITILGADDMRLSDALERLYRAQLDNPHSFIYDNVRAFADGVMRPDLVYRVSPYDFEKLLYKNHIHAGIMFPRKAWDEIGGYPEIFADGREDWAVNVALSIKGYCGVYLEDYSGYLYRREKHNRTISNTTQEKREVFLGKLKLLFPEIYAGERPEMCCGRPNNQPVINPNKKKKGVMLMETKNSTLIQYIGTNFGKQSYYGVSTGNQYRAGKSQPIVSVANVDLHGKPNRPGLLDIVENGRKIFQVYQIAKPKPAPAAASVPVAKKVTALAKKPAPVAKKIVAPVAKPILADIQNLSYNGIKKLAITKAQVPDYLAQEKSGKNRRSVIELLQGIK